MCRSVTRHSLAPLSGCLALETIDLTGIDSSVAISDESISGFFRSCQNLKTLRWKFCPDLLDDHLQDLSNHCKSLETLILDQDAKITGHGITAVCSLPNLKYLSISNCNRIDAVSFSNFIDVAKHKLVYVDVGLNKWITDHHLQQFAGCSNLSHLKLQQCNKISRTGLQALVNKQGKPFRLLGLQDNEQLGNASIDSLKLKFGASAVLSFITIQKK